MRPCLIHTYHAVTMPCHATPLSCRSESDLSRARHSAALERHGKDLLCVNLNRPSRDGMWATCPRSASFSYHSEFHEGCYKKETSSSDISVYYVDFHEEWQGRGMVCVNQRGRGTAWYEWITFRCLLCCHKQAVPFVWTEDWLACFEGQAAIPLYWFRWAVCSENCWDERCTEILSRILKVIDRFRGTYVLLEGWKCEWS
jgi:hypothetical protein